MTSVLVLDTNTGLHYPIELTPLGDGNYAFSMALTASTKVLVQDGLGNTLGTLAHPLNIDQGDLTSNVDSITLGDPVTTSQKASVDSSGNLHTAVHTNASRTAPVLHRSAITTADRLAAPGTLTVGTAGCTGATAPLVNGTTYYTAASAANKYGVTGPGLLPAGVAVSTGNLAVSVALAQVSGVTSGDATTGYDVFLGTTLAAPTFVARISEAQRAAGCIISAMNTVQTTAINGSTPVAGSVIVQTVGTGVACTANPFLANNAWTPEAVAAVGSINCVGYTRAHIKAVLSFASLASLPGLTLVPFFNNAFDTFWEQAQIQVLNIGSALGQSFRQDYVIDTDGATGMVICLVPSGTTPSVNVMIELA